MRQREVFGYTTARGRLLPVLLALFALCATFIPASKARQDGRPRRVSAVQRTAAANQPQQQPSPQKGASGAQTVGQTKPTSTPTNGAQARQTPTPAPTATPQTQGAPGAPKLQTSPSGQPDAAPTQGPSDQEIEEGGVVRVETNLVNLHVRVIDRFNRPVNDVRDNEFSVFESGVQQEVKFVSREEVPISYGLVVDNSGSLRNQINQVIEASKTIVGSNKPGDETFVVRFISSDEIKIMQDFTADQASVNDALDDMFVEGGQTAIIDAVYLAAEHAAERKKGDPVEDKRRRALVLVTDGEDRASFYKQEQLFDALKEADVQIYVIGFVNELEKDRGFISKSKRQKAVDLLDKMAKETGGRTFYPTSLSELPQIAQEITKDLRTQYVISYKPSVPARPGEYRPVRVAVADAGGRDKRIAVTRSGYTGKEGGATPPPSANKSPSTVRRQ
jgi:Ca-activated chloride channel family protein